MNTVLDAQRIRASTPAQLCQYYKELRAQASDELITAELLRAIEFGSVSPSNFDVWLGITQSPTVIREGLHQDHSAIVRQFAIAHFRRRLHSAAWRDAWTGVGDIPGILGILAGLSVMHVKKLCQILGRCAKGKDMKEKRDCITALFKALHPSTYVNTKYKTSDQRPLAKHYGLLLPACSEELVEFALTAGAKGIGKHARERDLLEHHPECLGRIQLSRLKNEEMKAIDREHIKSLANRYRTTVSPSDGFSNSMKYSLDCLRTLASLENSKIDESFVVNTIIQPLLNRAVRKRVKWDMILDIVHLTLQYFGKNPTAGKMINLDEKHIVHLVACCWSRKPQLFESQLRALFNHLVDGIKSLDTLTCWGKILSGTLPQRRYALMRFCIQASTGLDIDIDADLEKLKGGLSADLLAKLGPTQALEFFNRVRKVRGDFAFLEGSSYDSVLHLGIAYHVAIRETQIWHLHLLKQSGDHATALTLANEYIEGRKKSAKIASQPEQRGHQAKSALFAAIASGSLDCYADTLKWAERFMNDPLVLRELYPQTYPSEAVRLLSGIPEPIDSSSTISEIRNGVEKANLILSGMFDTACAAMIQPSFNAPGWNGVLSLFRRAVNERIKLTTVLLQTLKCAKEDLFDCFWSSTVQMLVTVEEKANSEACKKLGANDLRGLLAHGSHEIEELKIDVINIPAVRFIDELAKSRDALWSRLRASAHPSLSTMPDCLPRGLAIQHLIPRWTFDVEDLEIFAPYLSSRVKKTLTPDKQLAFQVVPADKRSQECVGVFVDSYKYALELYIPKCCTKTVRQERAKEVWKYATGPLSHDRVHKVDGVWYWKRVATHIPADWPPQEVRNTTVWPILPNSSDSGALVVWNPLEVEGLTNFPQKLETPTYIDLSVGVSLAMHDPATIGDTLPLKHLAYVPLSFENELIKLWDKSGPMSEAAVLLALLYLDGPFSEDGLLQSPFPSSSDVRYPAMSLSQDFMSRNFFSYRSAVRNIRGHLNIMPPELIHRLARRAIRALDYSEWTSGTPIYHEVAMQLIVRLGESDRPSLAIDLVIDTVTKQPRLSSWHRLLLKPSFLHRLSAADAAKCFRKLTSRINHSLQDTISVENVHEGKSISFTKPHGGDAIAESKEGPYVKITTLKLLIRLINSTKVISEGSAIEALGTLATIATHTDVRLNIVRSLLDMLDRYEATHADAIFTILESIVWEAGNLKERDPISESDWEKAEVTKEPPNIRWMIQDPVPTSSPTLHELLKHVRSEELSGKNFDDYLQRVLFPVFEKLKQQTARWVSIFLRKHGIDEAAERELNLPFVPWRTEFLLLRTMASHNNSNKFRALPSTLLKDLVDYAIYTVAPPSAIIVLHKKLRNISAMLSQSDIPVYLTFYDEGLDIARRIIPGGLFALLGKICTPYVEMEYDAYASISDGGITPQLVHEQTMILFKALVNHAEPSYISNSLLRDVLHGNYLQSHWWPTHGKPLLQEMIFYISSLRTEMWKTDPARKPSVLPNTFPWRLMLLDFPLPNTEDSMPESETKSRVFADQIANVVRELSRESAYHIKLAHLKSYLDLEPQSDSSIDHTKRDLLRQIMHRHCGLTALYLGDIGDTKEMNDLERRLRVEIAVILLERAGKASTMDKRVRERGQDMVQVWKQDRDEEVRRMGWGVRTVLLVKDKVGFFSG